MRKEDEEFDIDEFVEKFYKMAKNMTALRTEMVRLSKKMNDLPVNMSEKVSEKEERIQLFFDEVVKRMNNYEDFILVSFEGMKQEQTDLKNLLHGLQYEIGQQEKHVKALTDETKSDKQQTFSSNKQDFQELNAAVAQLQNHLKDLTDHLYQRDKKELDEREIRHVYLKGLQELILSQQKDIESIKVYIKADQMGIKGLIDNQLRGLEQEMQDTNRLILSIHAQMVNTSKELENRFEKSLEWEPIKDSIERLENMYLSLYEQQMKTNLIKENDITEEILREISQKVNKELEELKNMLQDFQIEMSKVTINSPNEKSELNKEGDIQALVSETLKTEEVETPEPNHLQTEEVQTPELNNLQQVATQTPEPKPRQQEATPSPEKSRVFNPFKGILTGQNLIENHSFSQIKVAEKELPIKTPFVNGIHFRSLQEVDLKNIRPANAYLFNQLSRPFATSTTSIKSVRIDKDNQVKNELHLEVNPIKELNEAPAKPLNESSITALHEAPAKALNKTPVKPPNESSVTALYEAPATELNKALVKPPNESSITALHEAPATELNKELVKPPNESSIAALHEAPATEFNKELVKPPNESSITALHEAPARELNETPVNFLNEKSVTASKETSNEPNNAYANERNEKLSKEINDATQNQGVTSFVSKEVNIPHQTELDNQRQTDWLFEEKNKGIKDYFASMFSLFNKEKKKGE